MFNFIRYSKYFYLFSGVLVVLSIIALFTYGLKFGIEFSGGSNMELEFLQDRPTNEEIKSSLQEFELGEVIVKPTGNKGVVLQFQGVDEQTHQQILQKLQESFSDEIENHQVLEQSFQYIGPVVGSELRNKTQIALVTTLVAITIYIALAFRKVGRPVASWKYGITSLIALAHDIIIPVGMFAVLGKLYNVEITIPIIAALLTILGFSVHDTIIIFDRTRENILRKGIGNFEEAVNNSLNETMGRSIATTSTLIIVLVFLFFLGGETLKYFALALIVGVTAGAYSSIFLAAPLLVSWYKMRSKQI